MDAGFDTIGNATIIAYDKGPVLVTDPWLAGTAYFGSWGLSHEIPAEQLEAAKAAPYIWISHGHPDHASSDSLAALDAKSKTILLPDHVGGRMRRDLEEAGNTVRVLPDREWVKLSDRVKVLCIADYNQDAVLLIDINGRLVVNLNDAADHGWRRFVAGGIGRYEKSCMLALSGFGDADMANFFNEEGARVTPLVDRKRFAVGTRMAKHAESFGAKYVVPFSSLHQYRRTDSAWANEFVTRLTDYPEGFSSRKVELLPAFLRYDCVTDKWEAIDPPEIPAELLRPEDCGDDWTTPLDADEQRAVTKYFQQVEHLGRHLDFVRLRVGGQETTVEFKRRGFRRGITFDCPRSSLMTAVRYEIFDDMLIGNFMKTTLHGQWPPSLLPVPRGACSTTLDSGDSGWARPSR